MGSEGYSNSSLNQKDPDTPPISWNPTIDHLFAKWCDHAKCFEWMHAESFDINYRSARRFMVTINVLTAIAGLSNVIAGNLTIPNTTFQVNWIFGGFSIGISTLNMLQDKLGYQQIADQHKKYASQWAQITSKIEEMLSLPANARRDCKTFLKMIKADMNQVSLDGNSLISEKVRDECYAKFKDIPNFDIPEICGKMSHTNTYNDLQVSAGNNDLTIKINSPTNGNSKSKATIKPIPSKKLIDNDTSKQQTANLNQVDTPADSPTNNSSKPDSFVIGSFTNDVKLAIESIAKDISIGVKENTNGSFINTLPVNTCVDLKKELISSIINNPSVDTIVVLDKESNSNIVSNPSVDTIVVLDKESNSNIVSNPSVDTSVVLDKESNSNIVSNPSVDTSVVLNEEININIVSNPSIDTSVVLNEKTNSNIVSTVVDTNKVLNNESDSSSDSENEKNTNSNVNIVTSIQKNPTSNQQKIPISTIKQNSRKTKK